MDLELHELDLRYESLRRRDAVREKRLLASLAEVGQQMPIVVVAGAEPGGRPIVVDGYKRVRLLRRLRVDTVAAMVWDLAESDALLLERVLRTSDGDSPLEQGWLLHELRDRFGLSGDELARRFDRTPSWVSRRLGLVDGLPHAIRKHVQTGAIGAHAAMRYLLPLARANRPQCERLADAVAPLRVTSRQMAVLYTAYVAGNEKSRELLLSHPEVVLRAHEQSKPPKVKPTLAEELLGDFDILAAVSRRARRRLRDDLAETLLPPEREELHRLFLQTRTAFDSLAKRCDKELSDAGPEHTSGDPAAA